MTWEVVKIWEEGLVRGPSCGCSGRTLGWLALSPDVVSHYSCVLPNLLMWQRGPKREHSRGTSCGNAFLAFYHICSCTSGQSAHMAKPRVSVEKDHMNTRTWDSLGPPKKVQGSFFLNPLKEWGKGVHDWWALGLGWNRGERPGQECWPHSCDLVD